MIQFLRHRWNHVNLPYAKAVCVVGAFFASLQLYSLFVITGAGQPFALCLLGAFLSIPILKVDGRFGFLAFVSPFLSILSVVFGLFVVVQAAQLTTDPTLTSFSWSYTAVAPLVMVQSVWLLFSQIIPGSEETDD